MGTHTVDPACGKGGGKVLIIIIIKYTTKIQLHHGNQDVHLSGMSHILTRLQPLMSYMQYQRLELFLLWQSGKSWLNMRP